MPSPHIQDDSYHLMNHSMDTYNKRNTHGSPPGQHANLLYTPSVQHTTGVANYHLPLLANVSQEPGVRSSTDRRSTTNQQIAQMTKAELRKVITKPSRTQSSLRKLTIKTTIHWKTKAKNVMRSFLPLYRHTSLLTNEQIKQYIDIPLSNIITIWLACAT